METQPKKDKLLFTNGPFVVESSRVFEEKDLIGLYVRSKFDDRVFKIIGISEAYPPIQDHSFIAEEVSTYYEVFSVRHCLPLKLILYNVNDPHSNSLWELVAQTS